MNKCVCAKVYVWDLCMRMVRLCDDSQLAPPLLEWILDGGTKMFGGMALCCLVGAPVAGFASYVAILFDGCGFVFQEW